MKASRDNVFNIVDDKSPKIFKNKDLLNIRILPESIDNLPGRDKHILDLVPLFKDLTRGGSRSKFLVGSRGTGKTATVLFLKSVIWNYLIKNNLLGHYIYIDCQISNNYPNIIKQMIKTYPENIRRKLTQKYKISGLEKSGINRKSYFHFFSECVKTHNKPTVIVLDQLDFLRTNYTYRPEITPSNDLDDILMNLFTLTCDLAENKCNGLLILGIMNRYDVVKKNLSLACLSRYSGHLFFGIYNKKELIEIIGTRKKAFCEGILNEDVIEVISEHVADRGGDARYLMEILIECGEYLEKTGGTKITKAILKKVSDQHYYDHIRNHIQNFSFHELFIYFSFFIVYYINNEHRKKSGQPVTIQDIISIYRQLITFYNQLYHKQIKFERYQRVTIYLNNFFQRGLLQKIKSGKYVTFLPPEDLDKKTLRGILIIREELKKEIFVKIMSEEKRVYI